MKEIFIDQLNERSRNDRAVMDKAFDSLEEIVRGKKDGGKVKDSDDPDLARTDRRLPLRPLRLRDLAAFLLGCIERRDVMWVLIACALVTALSMMGPFLNKQIFNDIIPSGSSANLIPIALVLIATGFGSVMFGVTRNLLLLRLRDKIDVSVQAAVLHRTYSLPVPFFRKYSSGDLGNRLMAVSRICSMLSDSVLSGLLTVVFSMTYFYQIFVYAPSLTGICVLMMSANLILLVMGYYCNSHFVRSIQPRASRLQGFVFAIISGIQKIKTAGAEQRAFAQWAENYKGTDPNDASRPLLIGLMPALSLLLSLGGTALLYNAAVNGGVQLSDYIAFSIAYGQVSGAVGVVAGLIPTLAQIQSQYDIARPILEAQPEQEDAEEEPYNLSGSIEVRNLRFKYPTASSYLFENLSLSIRAGEYVAIVGGSGCGKSTLIRLMLGFETPESGSIFYDHYNLAKVNKQTLRQQMVGTCLQDGKLFGGSIFQNITITAPLATPQEAWEAARLADVADDISEMPMQMHTIINDNGTGVSGGQRQRILIARAVVGKPRILFMDEATSALDNIRQENVAQNLAGINCTRVCIAHRLSTIKACDRIIVLEHGRVEEEGTFDELIARRGRFYELAKRQL